MAVTPPPDRLEPKPPRKGRYVNGIFFDSSPGQATSAFVRPGQQATGLRKRTAQEIALSDYITKMEEARNKRVIGDDIGAAPGLIADVLYRHGIKYPIESAARTASGENASLYLNPFSGISAGERIGRLGEDVINIASAYPGARAAANAAGDVLINRFVAGLPARQAEQLAVWDAFERKSAQIYENAKSRPRTGPKPPEGTPERLRWMHEPPQLTPEEQEFLRNRPNFPKPPAVARQTRAELAQRQAEGLRPAIAVNLGQGYTAEPPLVPAQPEGTVRVWHSNPMGLPVPEKLNPWEDYLGVDRAAERRGGTPRGNLVSSGLYGTESRGMSATYPQTTFEDRPLGYRPTGSYIPRDVRGAQYIFRNMENDFVDINTPIRDLPEFANGNFLYSPETRLTYGSSFDPDRSNFVDREDFNISKWNFGGKSQEEITLLDLINAAPNETLARAVVMATQKPIITTSTTKLKYPLYRNPGGSPTRSVMAREDMPAVLIENEPLRQWNPYVGGDFPQSSITVRSRAVNPEYEDLYTEYIPKTYYGSPYGRETLEGSVQYPPEALFPTNTPWNAAESRSGYPGQNYYDLPVTRDPQTGAITNVGGMKALDIGKIPTQERLSISRETSNWLVNDYGIDPDSPYLDEIIKRITRDKSRPDEALEDFRAAQSMIADIIDESLVKRGLPKNQLSNDVWWKFLKDKLGYEAVPHPGGVTTGNQPHQSYVFNSPEKLPPRTYVPPAMAQYGSDITASQMNEYLRALSESRRGSRGRAPMPFRTPSGNYLQSLYSGYLANQGLRQSPQGRQNIR